MKCPLDVQRKAYGHRDVEFRQRPRQKRRLGTHLSKTGVLHSCGTRQRAGKCQCLRKYTRERSGRKPVIEKSQELASLKPKEKKSINREQENARAHQPRNLMEMAGRAGRLIKSSTDGAWK